MSKGHPLLRLEGQKDAAIKAPHQRGTLVLFILSITLKTNLSL